MTNVLTEMALTAGAKVASKVGSKIATCVAGSLAGYGLGQCIIPAMRDSMEKKQATEEYQKMDPKDQQKAINNYYFRVQVVNGLCSAIGAVGAAAIDSVVGDAIDRSDISMCNIPNAALRTSIR